MAALDLFEQMRRQAEEQAETETPQREAAEVVDVVDAPVIADKAEVTAGAMQLIRSGLAKILPMQALEEELGLVLKAFQRIVISDEVRAREVTETIARMKRLGTTFEDDREQLVKPLNDHVKSINARYKPVTILLKDVETAGKAALSRYIAEKEKAAREAAAEAQRLADEEAAKKRAEAIANAPKNAPPPVEDIPLPSPPPEIPRSASQVRSFGGSTATTRSTWKYEVLDFSKVQAGYLMVNDDAVKKAIALGKRDIPGLRIYEDTTVVIKS